MRILATSADSTRSDKSAGCVTRVHESMVTVVQQTTASYYPNPNLTLPVVHYYKYVRRISSLMKTPSHG